MITIGEALLNALGGKYTEKEKIKYINMLNKAFENDPNIITKINN